MLLPRANSTGQKHKQICETNSSGHTNEPHREILVGYVYYYMYDQVLAS